MAHAHPRTPGKDLGPLGCFAPAVSLSAARHTKESPVAMWSKLHGSRAFFCFDFAKTNSLLCGFKNHIPMKEKRGFAGAAKPRVCQGFLACAPRARPALPFGKQGAVPPIFPPGGMQANGIPSGSCRAGPVSLLHPLGPRPGSMAGDAGVSVSAGRSNAAGHCRNGGAGAGVTLP